MELEIPSNGGTEAATISAEQGRIDGGGDASEPPDYFEDHRFSADVESLCSTPYASAPCSPAGSTWFYSAPTSPLHFLASPARSRSVELSCASDSPVSGSSEFDFSSRLSPIASAAIGSMSSADELFLNGQIRPITLSRQLQTPQMLTPLSDLESEDEVESDDEERNGCKDEKEEEFAYGPRGRDQILRNKSVHRMTRSLSPLRNREFDHLRDDDDDDDDDNADQFSVMSERAATESFENADRFSVVSEGVATESVNNVDRFSVMSEGVSSKSAADLKPQKEQSSMPSTSASSSRSSSSSGSGRSSKKWMFFKELLNRSKSEGSVTTRKEKSWKSKVMLSPGGEKCKLRRPPCLSQAHCYSVAEHSLDQYPPTSPTAKKVKQKKKGSKKGAAGKLSSGGGDTGRGSRRSPSAHELHYTSNRAQSEVLKKKTSLPYRPGLFGCLGISSKSYGAISGITKSLKPPAVSSQ